MTVEIRSRPPERHGLTYTPEYVIWAGMLNRVRHGYASVAPEWVSFTAFLAAVGPRPSSAHSLDRIDNDRGYEPGNVRWATATEQGRNRRTNRWIDIGGERLCITDWARRLEMSAPALHRLIRKYGTEGAIARRILRLRTGDTPVTNPSASFAAAVIAQWQHERASKPRRAKRTIAGEREGGGGDG